MVLMSDKQDGTEQEKNRDISDIITEISKFLNIDTSLSLEEQLEKIFESVILYKNLEDFVANDSLEKKNEISYEVKEKLLDLKEKMLERKVKERQKNTLRQEIDILEDQLKSEIQERKLKTGIRKLDDLLTGGIPFPSNIMIYGPPFAGKEEMIYNIITSSIQRGLPSIIVTFDRTSESLLQGMSYFSPLVNGYLELDMLYFIDTFTRTTREITSESKSIIYLDNQTDLEGVTRELNRISKDLTKKSGTVIVAIFGFSTILNFLDKSQTLKFLQTFATERKDQNSISFYTVEKGLHAESEIQALAHFMDGIIEFKLESNKSYLSVKGLTDAMSRDWIEIDFTKNSFNLKSFSLSKIR